MSATFRIVLSNGARMPTRGSLHAACWDLYSNCECILPQGFTSAVGTGVSLQPLETGWELRIRGRSGLSLRGTLCHPGTIDADYTGEIRVIMTQLSRVPLHIKPGDRIAQISAHHVERITWIPAESLNKTTRGDGGFGSTGR